MSDFETAVTVVLEHEGGYTDDSHDLGGRTNYGITQYDLTRCYERLNLPMDVKDLSIADAKKYYKSEWWDKYDFAAINSDYIASKIFDMAVNIGAHEAFTLIQRAIHFCGHNLAIDGILGANTLAAINEVSLHGREADLKYELQQEQKWYYEHLCEEKPSLDVFLKGWLQRAEY